MSSILRVGRHNVIPPIMQIRVMSPRTAAAATERVYDTFTDVAGTLLTAHAPETDVIGGGWSEYNAGLFKINATYAYESAEGVSPWPMAVIDAGIADGVLTGQAKSLNPNSAMGACFMFRFQNTTNYWRVALSRNVNQIQLSKIVAGVITLVDSAAWPQDANYHAFTCTLSGASIAIDVDGGTYSLSANDAALAGQTKIGISARGTASGNFDYIRFEG